MEGKPNEISYIRNYYPPVVKVLIPRLIYIENRYHVIVCEAHHTIMIHHVSSVMFTLETWQKVWSVLTIRSNRWHDLSCFVCFHHTQNVTDCVVDAIGTVHMIRQRLECGPYLQFKLQASTDFD